MAFSDVRYVDARTSVFSVVGRDQYLISEYTDTRDVLDKLMPVWMDPSKRTECVPNTREDILKFIVDWVHDPGGPQNILWLHGLAGSGKSTLSTTIASIYRDAGQLGAFLFFDRDVNERSDPSIVVRTLAHQLGSSDPRIGDAIRIAVKINLNIVMSPLGHQFQKLILEPVSIIADRNPTVIILDALDECGSPHDRERLLGVLANELVNLPSYFRTLITSRADIDIYDAFKFQPRILAHELDITSQGNSDDILSYFLHRMSLVRRKNRHLQLDSIWPGEHVLRQLVQQASGLFVWASTACEFINGHDPKKRLDVILRGHYSAASLDVLYTTALESIGIWDDGDFVEDFRTILGIILVARQPLSSAVIDALLHLPEDRPSIHTIVILGSVLSQSPSVRVLHPSFVDFLTTRSRCRHEMWLFDRATCDRNLALRCLDRMNVNLSRGICDGVAEDVAYACIFWIEHVHAIRDDCYAVAELLSGFLPRHLLHWFNIMSYLSREKDILPSLDLLLGWVTTRCPDHRLLTSLVQEIVRFARALAASIEKNSLGLYSTALPPAPDGSIIYQTLYHAPLVVSFPGGFHVPWLSLTVQAVSGNILSVNFSPGRTRMVSGSRNSSIRICDTASGAELVSSFRGHNNDVALMTFSPDGKWITPGSCDQSIRVYEALTWDEILHASHGHNHALLVDSSPDGTRIVSGSTDRSIRIWDTSSSARCLCLLGHVGEVECVAFSPDETSESSDRTVRSWEV